MTVTTTYTTHTKRYWKRVHPCLPEQNGTTVVYDQVVTTAKNAPSHRVAPAEPRFLNPTAMSQQYTLTKTYGEAQQGPVISAYEQCDGISLPVYYTKWYGITPANPTGAAPSTNWQLDMRLKIKEQAVNLGATLAEFGQTADSFERLAIGVHRAYRDVRRGRVPRALRNMSMCDVASAQLIASYGIRPLLTDVIDSVFALQDRITNPIYRRFVVTKRSAETVNISGSVGRWERSDRAICYVELEPERSNFTFGNLAEVTWEIVPFSFVIDAVIPIGDYLSSLDALRSVKSTIGTLCTRTKFDCSVNHLSYPTLTPATTAKRGYERAIIAEIPVPDFPRWEPSNSWHTVKNSLALLQSITRRC